MNSIVRHPAASPTMDLGTLMSRLQRWQQHCLERLGQQQGFFEFACQQINSRLLADFPDVVTPAVYVRTLAGALVQRIVDGKAVVHDPQVDGPFGWAVDLPPWAAPARHGVVTQMLEALAASLLGDYKAYLQAHWAADTFQLPEADAFSRLMLHKVGRHMAGYDKRLMAARASARSGGDLLEAIQAWESRWGEWLGWQRLATAKERAQVERALRQQLPDWVKLLSPQARQELEHRAAQMRDAEVQLERELTDLVSLQAHARRLVADYASRQWALELEPDAINVTTQVTMDVGVLARTLSLSELAACGPFAPSAEHIRSVKDDFASAQAPLSAEQLDELLAAVDPHQDYLQSLAQVYDQPGARQSMFDLRHARLRHSALAACCAGRLNEALYARVMLLGESQVAPPTDCNVVALSLFDQVDYADLLLFYTLDEQGMLDEMVLYAHGKPDGAEWVEVRSLRALSAEISSWLALDVGHQYLLGQVPEHHRERAARHFEAFRGNHQVWPLNRDPRSTTIGYQACLSRAVTLQQADHLAQVQLRESPPWFARIAYEERCTLNTMNEYLNLLERHFQQQMAGQQLFADFARQQVGKDIAGYLHAKGVTEQVDPETILFDVRNELGHLQLRTFSLLELAIYGYDDNWGLGNPRMPVRSSVGQDLSQLRAAELEPYLRSAYIGDKYARKVRADFLDEGDPLYPERRRTYLAMGRLMMMRDLRVTYAKGQINALLYERLSAVLATLGTRDTQRRPGGIAQESGIFNLSIMDKYFVMGCYLIAHADKDGTLLWLYTPQAPDGVSFRDYQAFAQALSPAMRRYLLDRVEFKAQGNADARLMAVAHERSDRDAVWEEFRIRDFHDEYNAYVRRYIKDVEDVTTSRGEVIERLVYRGLTFAAVPFCLMFPQLAFAVDAVYLVLSVREAIQAHGEGDTNGVLLGLMGASWATLGFLPLVPALVNGGRALSVRSLRAARASPPVSGARGVEGQRGRISGYAEYRLDRLQAFKRRPPGLSRINDESSIWHGTYLRTASLEHPQPLRCIRQQGKYYRVAHDGQTLRQVHPVAPSSRPGVPLRLSGEGRWVYNRVGALGGQPTPLSRVDELAATLGIPEYGGAAGGNVVARTIVPKGAMQGEAVVARFSAGAPVNFLHSLNGQSCVLVSLYNPTTRIGAVIHFDHNVKPLIHTAIGDVLGKLGTPGSGHRIRAVMAGGDWLTTADIGGPVRSALMRRGLLPSWDHWSYSACFGNSYAMKLDLATGATSVYKLASSHTANFYSPVLNAGFNGQAGAMNLRVTRFFTRFKAAPPWQKPGGTVIDSATREPLQPRAYEKFGFEVYSL